MPRSLVLFVVMAVVACTPSDSAPTPHTDIETTGSPERTSGRIDEVQTRLDVREPAFVSRLLHSMGPQPTDSWFFARIRSVVADRTGHVYALEDADQTVRVFSPEGRYLRSLGRRGSGPGEFAGARWLQVLGDTLWIYDNQNGRLSPFSTSTGTLLANTRGGPLPLRLLHLSPTGLFSSQPSHEERATAMNPQQVAIAHTGTGQVPPRTVASFSRQRAPLSYHAYPEGQSLIPAKRLGQLHTMQPLESSMLMRPGRGGGSLVLVDREPRVEQGASNPFASGARSQLLRIREVGVHGDTLRRFDVSVPALELTDAHLRAIVDSMSRSDIIVRGQRWVGDPAEIRDSLYRPRIWPATTEFFVGVDGTLWLRQPSPPSREARFWRLRADGTVLPSVGVRAGLIIHQVSEQRIWGVHEDADGVPTVEVHEIVPRGK